MRKCLRKVKSSNIIRPAIVAFGLAFAACSATAQKEPAPVSQKAEKAEEKKPDDTRWKGALVCARLGYRERDCPTRVLAEVWRLNKSQGRNFDPNDTELIRSRWGEYQRSDSLFAPGASSRGRAPSPPMAKEPKEKPDEQKSQSEDPDRKYYHANCLDIIGTPQDCETKMKKTKHFVKYGKKGKKHEFLALYGPFHDAIRCNDTGLAGAILAEDATFIGRDGQFYSPMEEKNSPPYFYPLTYSIIAGNTEMVKLLLEKGDIISKRSDDLFCIDKSLKYGDRFKSAEITLILKKHGQCDLYEEFADCKRKY